MATNERQINAPCLADGCPGLVGFTHRAAGAWRGECWTCGMVWALAPWVPTPRPEPMPRPLPPPPISGPEFADVLRREREVAGLSQGELARQTGVGRHAINRYEHGVIEPGWSNLARLCRVLPGLVGGLTADGESTPTTDDPSEPERPPASAVPRLRERLVVKAAAAVAAERMGAA